jgi:hypothetical protein
MIAGLAATAAVLLLATAPRIVHQRRAAQRVRQHKERFHRDYVLPLREFAREMERK